VEPSVEDKVQIFLRTAEDILEDFKKLDNFLTQLAGFYPPKILWYMFW
jgi:hypothetical protein